MEQFQQIDVTGALALIEQRGARLLDIRDPQSFASGRPPQAFHLSDGSFNALFNEVEFDTPLVVMCYHGISSQGAAQYLLHQGFEEVYNLQGGFEAWKALGPVESGEPE